MWPRTVLRIRCEHARLMIKDCCLWNEVLLFGLVGYCRFFTFDSPLGRNEDIVIPWKDNAKQDQEQTEVGQNKARNHHRVIPQGVELRICKAKHNSQNWSADITEQDRPECRDVPVTIATDHEIEITSQLITL